VAAIKIGFARAVTASGSPRVPRRPARLHQAGDPARAAAGSAGIWSMHHARPGEHPAPRHHRVV